jgi:hypothetical protein
MMPNGRFPDIKFVKLLSEFCPTKTKEQGLLSTFHIREFHTTLTLRKVYNLK